MNRRDAYRPEFVQTVPETIEEGVLYISPAFEVAVHNCACGCGHEVVTPLDPSGWRLFRNGERVSLRPSIGNWSFPCKSHYFIVNNAVVWAAAATPEMIAASRRIDNPLAHPAKPISRFERILAWLRSVWDALSKHRDHS